MTSIEMKVEKLVRDALNKLDIKTESILLEHPTDLSYGDFSTNSALVISKSEGKNPKELAKTIVDEISKDIDIEKIEIAGPGFINFFLSKTFYKNTLEKILSNTDSWGANDNSKGKKVMVEYTDPNPFKAFHIGHLMSNTVGESISRLIEFSGAEVKRANYQGDVGPQIAMAVWALIEGKGSIDTPNGLGEAYAYGARAYKEDKKEEIDAVNKAIYEGSDAEVTRIYEKGRKVSLDYFETLYKRLGTKFDYYFFESATALSGAEIVKRNVGTIFTESDGAIVFKGEEFDKKLHTRVFVNSKGFPTYEAKEIGLAYAKLEKYPFDTAITITANEIDTYFEVVKTALAQIDEELSSKIKHVSHGIMKLPSGKMSSRTGDVVTAESLIDEVKKVVLEIESERDIEDKEGNAEKIALAALKYMILRQDTKKDIVYDIERSVSFEGDSGPYLQYAYTRANAILEKTRKTESFEQEGDTTLLEKMLYRFPEVIEHSLSDLEVHHVTTYLTELSGVFNSFYGQEKIIGGNNESYNIALVKVFKLTIEKGLYILGIETPDRM